MSGTAPARTATPSDPELRAAVAAGVRIVPSEPWHAPDLAALQVTCFPNLGAQELMRAEHFLRHREVFPEADLVAEARSAPSGEALDAPRVVGLGSGFFTDFDFDHPDHTFLEMIDGGWFGRHDPQGAWYYGADVSVHPDYRGLGLARRLYDARKALVRRHRRRGIVAGGALPGYPRYRGRAVDRGVRRPRRRRRALRPHAHGAAAQRLRRRGPAARLPRGPRHRRLRHPDRVARPGVRRLNAFGAGRQPDEGGSAGACGRYRHVRNAGARRRPSARAGGHA
jgi:GNAT superfamily N-acetyltransferase